MTLRFNKEETFALFRTIVKWCVLGAWAGLLSGIASAIFLGSLAWATGYRELHPWMLFLLPIAGIGIGLAYHVWGKPIEGGNNLLLERIHNPNSAIPFRMAPLVFAGTVLTHLFGGSAGREGTAVQMGGTLANLASRPLRLSPGDHRIVIMSGISGGFGSVFGTPLAGAVFGLEVLSVGQISYEALIPCFVASVVGDLVCRGLGTTHHVYHVDVLIPHLSLYQWALVAIAGVLFGGASWLFAELTEAIHHLAKRFVPQPWMRPFFGGLAIIALTYIVGSRDYLGLSLPLIERAFTPEGVVLWAFALKILFTAVTLGSGFKGGEVTPLFCIGATLGAAFAHLTGQPTGFFAALGFVAVFAGAANTPLSCTLMGIELFGAPMAVPLLAACILAYILSGHRGIYLSQRMHTPKSHAILIPRGAVLRDARAGNMEFAPSRYTVAHLAGGSRRDGSSVRNGASHASRHKGDVLLNSNLPDSHVLTSAPHGMIRIFLRASDHTENSGMLGRVFGKPLYRTILEAAHKFGLPQGMVKQTISGFLNEKRLHHVHSEYDNASLPIYVELHGTREQLEAFCRQEKHLLHNRRILYKDVEHWGWDEERPETMLIVEETGEIEETV